MPLRVIVRVYEFFERSESASSVILSGASLRAQSKDLARSSARQTEMSGSSTDPSVDRVDSYLSLTYRQNPEIVDYARRTARGPSPPAAFAQDDRRMDEVAAAFLRRERSGREKSGESSRWRWKNSSTLTSRALHARARFTRTRAPSCPA